MARLNVESSVMFQMLSERAFHSRGPATANAFSPNLVRVLEDVETGSFLPISTYYVPEEKTFLSK